MDKTVQNKVRIVVAALGLIIASRNTVSLIISHLIINFPDQAVTTCQLVYTLISGMSVVGSLFFGVVSNKITRKNLATIFLLTILVGGAIGVVFGDRSIAVPFLASGLIGLGIGVLSPLIALIIADFFFDPKEKAGVVGLQTLFITLGGVIYPIVGGYLTARYWTYDYGIFFVTIPIILLVLIFLPKGQVESETKTNTDEKIKVWVPALKCWVLEMFIVSICMVAFNANATAIMKGFGFPNFVKLSSYAVLSMSAGGVIAALMLKILIKLGKPLMTYGAALTALGLFIMYFCQQPSLLWLVYVAGVVIGFGFSLIMGAGYVFIPQSIDRRTIPKALSFFSAANLLGFFINPYVITATAGMINNSIYTRYLLAGCLCLAITIFAFATQKIKEAQKANI